MKNNVKKLCNYINMRWVCSSLLKISLLLRDLALIKCLSDLRVICIVEGRWGYEKRESINHSAVSLWELMGCSPIGCSLSGSSVLGIFQARIPEWIAMPFSRGSFWPRDWTQVFCITKRFFTIWATKEALGQVMHASLWRVFYDTVLMYRLYARLLITIIPNCQ